MTDAERIRCLRRLRFPAPLEGEFQAHYFAQNRAFVRVCLAALTVPLLWYVFDGWRAEGENPLRDPNLQLALLLLAEFALTFPRPAWRLFYPAVVAGAVWESLTIPVQAYISISDYLHAHRGVAALDVVMATMSFFLPIIHVLRALTYRLPAGWTVLYLLTTAGLVRQEIHFTGIAPHIVLHNCVGMLPVPILVVALTAYYLERSSRAEFLATRLLREEQAKSEALLLNILPAPIAARLKDGPDVIADAHAEVSVLFADIVDFTPLSARLPAAEVVALLNGVFSAFDALAARHGLEKIKTVGDAYMVVAGLPEPRPDHAQAVAEMALGMRQAAAGFRRPGGDSLTLRMGIATGPVVAGVIGTRKFAYDLWGDTVNVASRMESHGVPGTIQVTEETFRRLAGAFAFSPPRAVEVKGRGAMTVYALEGRRAESCPSVPVGRVR